MNTDVSNIDNSGVDIEKLEKISLSEAIARDLALNPMEVDDICAAYKISRTELSSIAKNKAFSEAYKFYNKQIKGEPESAPQLKARDALMMVIPHLSAMILSEETMNMDKVSAAKLLASIAGAGDKAANKGGNMGVQVNLHLGSSTISAAGVIDGV